MAKKDNGEVLDEFETKLKTEKIEPLEKRVKDLENKLEYKSFQGDVEDIIKKTLGHDDGKKVIKPFIQEIIKDFLTEQSWKSKQFWIPTAIAILGVIIAYFKA